MKIKFALGAVLLFIALASPAMAQVADIPLPIIVGKGDLIVVAEVTEAGAPKEMELKNPDFGGQAHKDWYRTFKVKVTREPGQAGAAGKPADKPAGKEAKAEKKMEIMAMCAAPPPPPPQGGGLVRVQPIIMDGPSYPNLQVGKSYMLILSKLPDRKEHYLPSYFKNFRLDTDPMAKEIEKLANVNAWPWSKAQKGLQLACLANGYAMTDPKGQAAFIQACVAVRNVSDKPVALNLYDADKCLQITATSTAGAFSSNFYDGLREAGKFDASSTIVVKPKEMVFIGPSGLANGGLGFRLPMKPGKYEFHATYTSSREGKGKDDLELWKGTLNSKPAPQDIQVPGQDKPDDTSKPKRIEEAVPVPVKMPAAAN